MLQSHAMEHLTLKPTRYILIIFQCRAWIVEFILPVDKNKVKNLNMMKNVKSWNGEEETTNEEKHLNDEISSEETTLNNSPISV